VQIPMAECGSDRPRAVLDMFDVPGRPGVPADYLAFSIPIRKLELMVDNMDESFLITGLWKKKIASADNLSGGPVFLRRTFVSVQAKAEDD
jgi:hypothetical protein